MNGRSSFGAFILGTLVGAAVGLLYAPSAGERTRTALRTNAQVLKDRAMVSLYEAETRLEAITEESKKRLGKLQEIGQHTLEEQKQSLKAGYQQARDVVAGDGNTGRDEG